MNDAWAAVRELQTRACALAIDSKLSNSLRMAGIKITEQVILLFTAGTAPPLPGVQVSSVLCVASDLGRQLC